MEVNRVALKGLADAPGICTGAQMNTDSLRNLKAFKIELTGGQSQFIMPLWQGPRTRIHAEAESFEMRYLTVVNGEVRLESARMTYSGLRVHENSVQLSLQRGSPPSGPDVRVRNLREENLLTVLNTLAAARVAQPVGAAPTGAQASAQQQSSGGLCHAQRLITSNSALMSTLREGQTVGLSPGALPPERTAPRETLN